MRGHGVASSRLLTRDFSDGIERGEAGKRAELLSIRYINPHTPIETRRLSSSNC